jgi:hypothetical protein
MRYFTMIKRLLVCLLFYLPAHVSAAIIFEFESVCTDFIRNTECAFFGLGATDPVTGGFIVEDQFGAPGAISFLSNDQYQLIFTFGNQSFTEQDATGPLGFNVNIVGSGFSSILGNFQNANGAQLTLLTVVTGNIALNGFEADTFGGGGGWVLAEGSDLFTQSVPLPASIWLFLSAAGMLGVFVKSNKKVRRHCCTT